jgi:hypothetical protein
MTAPPKLRTSLDLTRPNAPPPKPDCNAVRRAVLALARDLLIRARIIGLRRLAEQTARGDLPVPDEDPIDR